MKDFRLKNVRLVDAEKDEIGDIYIKEGKIRASDGGEKNYTDIDGSGKVLMPSFADLHAHFRDPGLTRKEDIESGSKAAVKGGYASVALMANTNPICSGMETVRYVKNRAAEVGLVDVEQIVSVTDGMRGESISHLEALDGSIKFLSDDGKGVMSDEIMEKVLEMSKQKKIVVISHAEDHRFSATDMRMAENVMTERDIALCLKTGGRLHLAHVSTKEAIKMVIDAKKRGANLTCEVTPHHIFSTDEINYRVNPPLRKRDDVEAIVEAIKAGYIDAIATDHAPHTAEDKVAGAPGISGIETAFQICFTKLVKEGHISLQKLSELMSYNPSKIMGLNKGLLKDGFDGDVVLIDIDKKTKIDAENFASKGKNSPFHNCEVTGEILMTIKKGRVVYRRYQCPDKGGIC